MFAGLSLPKLLASRTERHPGKAFLIWEPFSGSSQTWSYAEFSRAVEQLASGLYSRGIRSGNKVLLHMENCPEFLISWFACARLGVVAVSTNTRSVARDMAYFAEQSQAVAALTQPRFADLVKASSDNFQFVATTATDAGEAATGPLPAGVIDFDDLPMEALELPEEDPAHSQTSQSSSHRVPPHDRKPYCGPTPMHCGARV
jgi:crotonobetaine/carnitine-CoA ligase